MSAFTFADAIVQRRHITKEEFDFLIKSHNICEERAIEIMKTFGLEQIAIHKEQERRTK